MPSVTYAAHRHKGPDPAPKRVVIELSVADLRYFAPILKQELSFLRQGSTEWVAAQKILHAAEKVGLILESLE